MQKVISMTAESKYQHRWYIVSKFTITILVIALRSFLPLLMTFSMLSCKKEMEAPTVALNEIINMNSARIGTGIFQNGPYGVVSGTASIYQNIDETFSIALDSFSTSNGPDLYVYLSMQPMPVNFIEVGKLRSTNGKQVYTINGTTNISGYKYISIHCKAYNHLFGFAMLP